MFTQTKHITLSILAAALVAAAIPGTASAQRVAELVTGGSGDFSAGDLRTSDDGSRAVFVTGERLDPADTDTKVDIYERAAGQTTLVSAGGTGSADASLQRVAPDGRQVVFVTADGLVPADTDGLTDVYEWSAGQLRLVSVGTSQYAFYSGVAAAGSRIYFTTAEALSATDTDSKPDVYERSGGQTALVSVGGAGTSYVQFAGASADGSHVFLITEDKLSSTDLDDQQDIYERANGRTTLLSVGYENAAQRAEFAGASEDGSRVFITTAERLLPADTDTQVDLYQRSAEETTLLSSGGNGAGRVYLQKASKDGTRVFMQTVERLTAADTDAVPDVYERAGGQITLISGGSGAFPASLAGITADGSRAFFTTAEALAAEDTDAKQDVYERTGGRLTLISGRGNGNHDASFDGMSSDGNRVFFTTREPLTDADTDSDYDVYEHSAGQTELVSRGGSSGVTYAGASTDGRAVFFYTLDALVPEDVDKTNDVYVARLPQPAEIPGPGQEGPVAGGDQAAPVITRASLTRGRFAVSGGRRASTAFRFTVSEPATVRISIARRASGRRVRGRCVVPRRANQRRPHCLRPVTVGAIAARAGSGSNRVAFNGRLRGRALTPGRYVATLTATDADGNRSRAVAVTFTVIKARR